MLACDTTTSNLSENNNKPVISLSGNDTITINEGDTFEDPGYAAFDSEDGDLKDSVKIKWLDEDGVTVLDTSKNVTDTSLFLLKYSVKDKDENSVEKFRYIKFIPGGKIVELLIGTITPTSLTIMQLESDSVTVDVYCSKTLNTSDVSVKAIDDLGGENQFFNTAWDFRELESITIDGYLEGSIKIFFEYKTENITDPWGYHQISIKTDIDKLEDISGDYLISDFKVLEGTHVAQSGITWEEASKKVCSFCIELDTDATQGGDLAVLDFDEIKFNFKNRAGKKKAFPFMG